MVKRLAHGHYTAEVGIDRTLASEILGAGFLTCCFQLRRVSVPMFHIQMPYEYGVRRGSNGTVIELSSANRSQYGRYLMNTLLGMVYL